MLVECIGRIDRQIVGRREIPARWKRETLARIARAVDQSQNPHTSFQLADGSPHRGAHDRLRNADPEWDARSGQQSLRPVEEGVRLFAVAGLYLDAARIDLRDEQIHE